MNNRIRVAALLMALPMSTILVGCGGDEDTDRQALEREALERELELALQPDTTIQPELADVPAQEPVAEPDAPRTSPAPVQQPRRQPTTPARETQPRRSEPAPRPARQPSQPRVTTFPVPAGTTFAVRMNDELSTQTSAVGETFTATLAEPIIGADGRTLIPAGATVRGRVTESRKSGNAGQQAYLKIDFTSVSFGGRSYAIDATTLDAEARLRSRSSTTEKAATVGGGAAIGAVLGQVIGRDTRSTVAGAAIGAAAGTAVAMGTDDVDAVIPAGGRVTVRLDNTVRVDG